MLLLGVVVTSLLVSAKGVVAVASAPAAANAELGHEQVRWLQEEVHAGAPEQMQTLIPEGYLFTVVLTGLAVAADPDADNAEAEVRDLLALADSSAGTAPFDPSASPRYGIFHAAWTLLLAVELGRLSGSDADEALVRQRAEGITAALGCWTAHGLPASRSSS